MPEWKSTLQGQTQNAAVFFLCLLPGSMALITNQVIVISQGPEVHSQP